MRFPGRSPDSSLAAGHAAHGVTDALTPETVRSRLCPTQGSNQGPALQAPCAVTAEPLDLLGFKEGWREGRGWLGLTIPPSVTGYPSDNHMPAIAGATGNSTSSAGASTATTPSAVGHYAPLKAVTPMFTSSSRQSRSASPSASVSASPAGSAVSSPTVKAPSSKGFSAFGGTSTAGALAGVKDTHRSPRRLVRRSSSMNRRVGVAPSLACLQS